MDQLIKHHKASCDMRCQLSVPDEKPLRSILVEVDIIPDNATCEIYGLSENGESACVIVNGSQDAVDLPFISPDICVRHADDVIVRVSTIGYRGALH